EVVIVTKTIQRVDGALARELIKGHAARGCAERLKSEDGFRVELKTAVEAAEIIMALDEIVARGDEAKGVFAAHIALQAQDADVSVLVEERLDETPEESRVGARRLAIFIAEVAGRVV